MQTYQVTWTNFETPVMARARLAISHAELTAAKDEIAAVCATHATEWERASRAYELSHTLARAARGVAGVPRDASNAWFKPRELFARWNVDLTRQFDNAALPGDFIRAAQAHAGTVDWRANSLVGGLDDRFGLWRDNPERWAMLATPTDLADAHTDRTDVRTDRTDVRTDVTDVRTGVTDVRTGVTDVRTGVTGDITDAHTLSATLSWLAGWRATTYTSDLGFACAPAQQESAHGAALEAQVRWAEAIVGRGGTAIIKAFTAHDAATWRTMRRFARGYREFWIAKPATSKADNSERYWIGCGAQLGESDAQLGESDAQLSESGTGAQLSEIDAGDPLDRALYPHSALEAEEALAAAQSAAIRRNIAHWRARTAPDRAVMDARVREWMQLYL